MDQDDSASAKKERWWHWSETKRPTPWGPGLAFMLAIGVSLVVEVLLYLVADSVGVFEGESNRNNLIFRTVALVLQLAVVLWILKAIARRPLSQVLGFMRPTRTHIGLLIKVLAVYLVGLVFIIGPLMEFLLPPELVDQVQDIGIQLAGLPPLELVVTVGLIAVLVPVVEEVLYRGILFRGFGRVMPGWAAAVIASVLFAALHLQWNVAIDTFFLSLLLCLVYTRTQNLWVPIGLHAAKNGLALIILTFT